MIKYEKVITYLIHMRAILYLRLKCHSNILYFINPRKESIRYYDSEYRHTCGEKKSNSYNKSNIFWKDSM